MHQTIQLFTLLRRKRSHIEPQLADRAVAREDLSDLTHIVLVMCRSNPISIVIADRIGFREMPIDKREINAELHTRTLTGIAQFFHHIATRRSGLHDIEWSLSRAIHAEAIVMFGSKHDTLHPCFPS